MDGEHRILWDGRPHPGPSVCGDGPAERDIAQPPHHQNVGLIVSFYRAICFICVPGNSRMNVPKVRQATESGKIGVRQMTKLFLEVGALAMCALPVLGALDVWSDASIKLGGVLTSTATD